MPGCCATASTGATAIVDPADPQPIIEAIEKAGGRLDMILLTHHHGDHIAGTDEVRARFNCPVIGATADRHRLPKLDKAVAEGDTVKLGNATGQVIETPGHTRGQINFFFPDGAVLLSGDTLFSLGCGRLIEGTAEEMFDSLAKLKALPPETAGLLRPRIHRKQRPLRAGRRSREPRPAHLHGQGRAVACCRPAKRSVASRRRIEGQPVPASARRCDLRHRAGEERQVLTEDA